MKNIELPISRCKKLDEPLVLSGLLCKASVFLSLDLNLLIMP